MFVDSCGESFPDRLNDFRSNFLVVFFIIGEKLKHTADTTGKYFTTY